MADNVYTEKDATRVITLVRRMDGKFVPQLTSEGRDMEARFDYDGRSDSNPVYAGIGRCLALTSDTDWQIKKFTYDSSGRPVWIQCAEGAWDSRVSLF